MNWIRFETVLIRIKLQICKFFFWYEPKVAIVEHFLAVGVKLPIVALSWIVFVTWDYSKRTFRHFEKISKIFYLS